MLRFQSLYQAVAVLGRPAAQGAGARVLRPCRYALTLAGRLVSLA